MGFEILAAVEQFDAVVKRFQVSGGALGKRQ
jgi:hypothetical protein